MIDLGLLQFRINTEKNFSTTEILDYLDGGYKNPNNPVEQFRISVVDDVIELYNDIINSPRSSQAEIDDVKSLLEKIKDYRIHPEKYFYTQPSIEDLHFNSD